MGRNTGITVSKDNSRVSGYNIGVVKGKEIAQKVCFISLTLTLQVKLVLIQPQLILLTTMAESISQEHHINYSNVIPNLLVLVFTLIPIMMSCCGLHCTYSILH